MPAEPNLRSEFDYGPARVRRRFTRQLAQIQFDIILTNAEYEYFEGFYDSDLNLGVSWFNMPVYLGRGNYEVKRVRFIQHPQINEPFFGHVRLSCKFELINAPVITGGSVWLLNFFGEEGLFDVSDGLDHAVNEQYPAATQGV